MTSDILIKVSFSMPFVALTNHISRFGIHKQRIDLCVARPRKRDVRPELAVLFLETQRFQAAVELFGQFLHRWGFYSRPEHPGRTVAGKKSDTAHCYSKRFPS